MEQASPDVVSGLDVMLNCKGLAGVSDRPHPATLATLAATPGDARMALTAMLNSCDRKLIPVLGDCGDCRSNTMLI
jgi:hypothetical protein